MKVREQICLSYRLVDGADEAGDSTYELGSVSAQKEFRVIFTMRVDPSYASSPFASSGWEACRIAPVTFSYSTYDPYPFKPR